MTRPEWCPTKEGWMLDYAAERVLPFAASIVLLGRGRVQDRAAGDAGATWRELGRGEPLVAPFQVHGTAVVPGGRIWALPTRPRADGVLLEKVGVCGSLRFADCFPVVVAGALPRPWILLLHAGYRGVVRGIVTEAMGHLVSRRGRTLDGAFAWVGPGIGSCCYIRRREDPETRRGMECLSRECWKDEGGFVRFDLAGALCAELAACGVDLARVLLLSECTHCTLEKLYSYRGGDAEARNFLCASIAGESTNGMRQG